MWLPPSIHATSSPCHRRRLAHWFKTGFSPRKAQLTFYGLNDLPDAIALLPSLGKYTSGVSCVYAKKLDDIDLDVLRQLIAIASTRGDDPEPA
jgi:hypothetical protein